MTRLTELLLLCVAGSLLISAQQTPPQTSVPAAGVTPDWEVETRLKAMAADISRLEPMMREVNPAQWIEKGASGTYVQQLRSAQNAVQEVINAAQRLAEKPGNSKFALEAYFQLERMELLLDSISSGVRRYQSATLSAQVTEMVSSSKRHRDYLRQHIRDLTTIHEQEFQIAHEEAQRCRATLTRQAPPDRRSGVRQQRPLDRN